MQKDFRIFKISTQAEERVFIILTSAIAFSIPFQAIYNSILCISLLVFWIFFMKKIFQWPRIKIILAISILFWMALIGMVYSQNSEEGWFRLQQKSLLILLPLVFGTISIDWQKDFKWIATFFVAGTLSACVISLLVALLFAIQHHHFEKFFSQDLAAATDLYTYLFAISCLVSSLIMIEVGLGNLEIHRWLRHRSSVMGLIAFFSVFILLLSVKQIILAWIIIFIAYSIRMKANRRFLLITLIAGFLLITASVFLIPTLKAKIDEVINGQDNTIPLDQDASLGKGWNGIAMRKAVWVCSLDAIKADPWIGVGTGDGQDKLQAAYENRQFYFASRYNHFNTHNQYLQTIVNYGFIGLLIWLASLLWLCGVFKSNWLVVSLLSCLLFAMLTESMLETNKGIVLTSFVLTVFIFRQPTVTPNQKDSFM
jgi:O-antigen ligase